MFMLCPKRFGSEQSKIGSNPSWSNIFMNLRFHEIFSKFIILIYSWLKCYKISREITAEYKFKCDSLNGLHPFLTRDHPYTTSAIFPDFWHPTPPCRFFSTIYRQFWPIIDPSPPPNCRLRLWRDPYSRVFMDRELSLAKLLTPPSRWAKWFWHLLGSH